MPSDERSPEVPYIKQCDTYGDVMRCGFDAIAKLQRPLNFN